jgi:hypothetical protein
MTLSDIIRNALDREYPLEWAAADLGELMTERELIKRKGDTDTHRFRELEQIIPMQEKLAIGKLHGDELFDRLDLLNIRVEKA